jgi:RNA polymerase sigma-70 factor (ECF subfamily)
VDPSDEALMAAFAAGDEFAFERLYARYKTLMLNYFLRASGRRALAEELFQELFLRVLGARDRYQPQRPFRVWLYTLARNLLRDRWRQRSRRLSRARKPRRGCAPSVP